MRVLVVGASGLLGRAVCDALEGRADVVRASRSDASHPVDISDRSSLAALLGSVGEVDGIVCVAGTGRFKPWAEVADEDWDHSLANKLRGQVEVVRQGARVVRPRGGITLTSGLLAGAPVAGSSILTPVNAAVDAFTRAAALELAPDVRVNCVSPGWVGDGPGEITPAEVARAYADLAFGGTTGAVVSATA